MIKALIFDFDGLILDTETPALESWQTLYRQYGHELPLADWYTTLGRGQGEGFDAAVALAALIGSDADLALLRQQRQTLKQRLSDALTLLPGVEALLDQADERGMPCAVASSSPRSWVEPLLRRQGIYERFACVRTREDVPLAKPAPDLFLAAASCLGMQPADCLVFEDSPNGVIAAAAAGMRCALVPGPITLNVDLPVADVRLARLDEHLLDDLLTRLDRPDRNACSEPAS